MLRQYLVVRLADTQMAFDLAYVSEVAQKGTQMPVPGARTGLAGLTYLRGRILPVIDLAACLGIKQAAGEADGEMSGMNVIVAHNGTLYSFGVDAVFETVRIAAEDIMPVPANLGSAWQRFGRGVQQHQDGLVVIFDMPALLDSLCAGT